MAPITIVAPNKVSHFVGIPPAAHLLMRVLKTKIENEIKMYEPYHYILG